MEQFTKKSMIIKLMGIIDLITALVLILIPFNIINWQGMIIGTLYLLLKSYLFKGDIASIIDGISGVYLFLTFLGVTTIFTPIFGAYLIQKSIFSLL